MVDAASVLTPSKLRSKVEHWRAEVDRAADESYERACHRRRSLKFFRSLDGMVRLEGLFEAETGRILRNAVDDLVRGQRLDESGRTREQRQADALVELANAYNAGTVTGGRERPQMLVTVDAEQLAMRAGGRALLDTGETITIEAARRIACDAESPPCSSAARARSWISGAADGWPATSSTKRSSFATGGAGSRAVTGHPGGHKPITSCNGPTEAEPTSTTSSSYATPTTA